MLKLIALGIFILASFSSISQLSQSVDSLFRAFNHRGLFEGSALIADSSGIIYQKSFGHANRDHRILNSDSTVFRLGSLEKQFTAMLVLQLVEKGKLNLQAKISEYLPTYRKEIAKKVTIEQLLTHTSGIPSYTAITNVWEDSLQLVYDPAYILNHFCSRDLEFQPGTKYKYSNTGYFILAQIIEKVTGKSLANVLSEYILIPAGMKNTALEDNTTVIRNKALGYFRLGNDYVNESYIYAPNAKGAASIYSTTNDLYLWDRVLYSNRLLSDSLMLKYNAAHHRIDAAYAYGFGWEFTKAAVSEHDTVNTMEHSGAMRAFRSLIFRIPAEKKCIILLSNCANQSGYELFDNIMKLFRGRHWTAPQVLLADTLYSIMQKQSIAEAINVYKNWRKTDSLSYDLSSASLECLGERLLAFQQYEAAAAVFTLAVAQYPTYIHGQYYLGKAFEKWGRRKEAIVAYERAIAMDRNKKSRPAIDAAVQLNYLRKQKH